MNSFTLTTPVALIVFNRPEETLRVFAAIRKAQPQQLLVIADGPRPNRSGESDLCAKVRQIVKQVDWSCNVLHCYSETNLGCKKRVSSGLDWVFTQVEEVIILEDDCLPDQSFFRFCQVLLGHYRNDHRIGMISGDNFQSSCHNIDESYYFSKYFHIWGWATWRDRWVGIYDVDMNQWPQDRHESWLLNILNDKSELAVWKNNFDKAYFGKIDTWDYQWTFANWLNGRLCILPTLNLVSNIGFNSRATHTKLHDNLSEMDCCSIGFPLVHPSNVLRNIKADESSQHRCSKRSFGMSLYNQLIGWIKIKW